MPAVATMPNAKLIRRLFVLPLALPLTLALPLVSGCGTRGSGTAASEVREVESFDKIDLGGAFHLVVHVQPGATQKLEITADDNILPKIQASVSGGELDVGFGNISFIRPKIPIKVEVWVPALSKVDASGAADITIDGLHGERFELELSGASDSSLSGAVDQLDVDISGAGELDAKKLQAKSVVLDLSGAAEAEVWASETLDVDISGAGEVGYWGNPATVNQDISGAGSLEKRD